MWSAVLRTDNATRKVRASLSVLARDAGLHRNTATAAFAETNTKVLRYFEKVVRRERRIDLWFHPSDHLATGSMHSTCAREPDEDEDGDAQHMGGDAQDVGKGLHSTCAPSASLPKSAITSFIKPSSLQVGENVSDTESAAEDDIPDDTRPCGCSGGMSCPECRGDVQRASRHTPEKLKMFHDQQAERDEGIGVDGTPIDQGIPSTGYRSRARS